MAKYLPSLLAATCSILFSGNCISNTSVGIGYSNFNDLDLNMVYGSLNYEITFEPLTLAPELRVGYGIDDSDLSNEPGYIGQLTQFEIDDFVSFGLRLNYPINDSISVFAYPSYSRLTITGRSGEQKVSDSTWDFNAGIGASYKLNKSISIDAIYESVSDEDLLTLGVRFNF